MANLDANWDTAGELVGQRRARIWRLYMAASALSFEMGRTSIHQVLAVRPGGLHRATAVNATTPFFGFYAAREFLVSTRWDGSTSSW